MFEVVLELFVGGMVVGLGINMYFEFGICVVCVFVEMIEIFFVEVVDYFEVNV